VAEIARHCPDCGPDHPLEQFHDQPGACPDAPDGDCPEWSCTACETALLIGAPWFAPELAHAAELRGRVA
jgi:hypothetical protein